ncbi:hypothetical protein [Sulfurovum sp. NBC37-1]|uniref:hypothetical protein n=1 Tax=Sulfurovum sp. (strain NBC37-1) TaxID=387093 RepID=UPI0011D0DAD4|nr:hypothetical protein [Sulfurovum sp. NBC37-1]
MQTAMTFTIILVFLELFEAFMQRSDTLYGVMERLYGWYQKSIFLFFAMHPAFYFILFVVIATNTLNIYMILILSFKIFDLFYKLELIKKIFMRGDVPQDLAAMLEWKIPSWFFLMGVALYPPLLYYGLM